MRIEQWLKFLNADNEEDRSKVIKFMILWMAYNKWYNDKYFTLYGQFNDKKKAIELSKNEKALEIYEQLKKQFLVSFKNIPSLHCEKGQRDRLWADSSIEVEVLFNDQHSDLLQFLTLIYQMRCNFLHGNKEQNAVNVELIVWAYDMLNMFLQKLIQKRIIELDLEN